MSEGSTRIRVSSDVGAISGQLWFAGWLFTIGFAGLHFWQGVLAVVLWPYFLGMALK